MRVFMIGVFLLIYSIISLPLYLVEYFIGKKNQKLKIQIAQWVVKNAFKVILFLAGARVHCYGKENVPKDEAILYVANHRDYFDILAGYSTVPTLTGFVSKKELQRVPCINHWMKILNCLFLDRADNKEGLKTILQGIQQLKDGYSIFIMPEGTRNHSNELLPFHEGSFKLATKSGATIVPVAMTNTDKVLGNHLGWFHPVHITIAYGSPIRVSELTKEETKCLGAKTRKIIQEMLENINKDMIE